MPRRFFWIATIAVVAMLPRNSAFGQSVWEVTPYETQVLLAFGDQPDTPAPWREELRLALSRKLKVVFRATWHSKVLIAEGTARAEILGSLDRLTAAELTKVIPESRESDKTFLVRLVGSREGYHIQVREFDGTLLRLGPMERASVDTLAEVSRRTTQLVADAFSPLVRIDRYSDGVARTRLRAGALIQGEQTAARLQAGDVLLPFDRKISSTGQTEAKNIRAIDWTYLLVSEPTSSSTSSLDVISGYKQPFRTKRNRRNQQIAMRAKRTTAVSTIRLQSRSEEPVPLIGYEIHEKGEQKTKFIGYTNWRGELVIPAGESPIRTLLVRSGGRVTAKLPIVPGLREVVVASMRDDRQRVETDGFLSGIQTQLVDLVAQRESLTARIRRLISNRELDDARRLLDQIRDLPSKSDFESDIRRQQQTLKITDPSLRTRIDTMFVQTGRTLGKYLDPRRISELEAELSAAQ